MFQDSGPILPEDYLEPNCPLDCGPDRRIQSVPQRRILEKLDEYMAHRDFPAAERHLMYWKTEAREGNDLQGQLLIANELIGYYRKTGKREETFAACAEALSLLSRLRFSDNASAATTYVNAATAYSAFGKEGEAIPLFSKARSIYESQPQTAPELLGGLYNNMGLACASMANYDEACSLYQLALEQMRKVPDGELEQAITLLNIADALDAQGSNPAKEGQIRSLLSEAKVLLLHTGAERGGYYAFVCEKCAPGFRYYGDEETAKQLEQFVEQFYEGT